MLCIEQRRTQILPKETSEIEYPISCDPMSSRSLVSTNNKKLNQNAVEYTATCK